MNINKRLLHFVMMICCVLPILAFLFYAPQIKAGLSGFNPSWLILLICPLMHLVMMKFMHGSHKDCDNNNVQEEPIHQTKEQS